MYKVASTSSSTSLMERLVPLNPDNFFTQRSVTRSFTRKYEKNLKEELEHWVQTGLEREITAVIKVREEWKSSHRIAFGGSL